MTDINFSVDRAGERYAALLNVLRSQVIVVLRTAPTSEAARYEAVAVANGAARSFASTEQGALNEAGIDIANDAWRQVNEDMSLEPSPIPEDYHTFIFESVSYIARILAAQADRDVVSMAQHIRTNAMQIDFQVRGGKSMNRAAAEVMLGDRETVTFRFTDRIGRNYKSAKHIRDTIRQNLLNVYNEVYMAAAFAAGHTTLEITHPDPEYKWFGTEIAIVEGRDLPSYYEVREEVFHPSSEARLTIKN